MTAMQSRLKASISRLREENRAGLVVYLTAGDPDYYASLALLDAAAEADMVEIGIPFSDPVADGPVLQAAHMRALAAGQTVKKTLGMLTAWRLMHPTVPAILMGYLNPVLAYGVEAFMRDAAIAGADAVILVDLPFEHAAPYRAAAVANGLSLVQMTAPTTPNERLAMVLKEADGFVYQVMLTGTTGAAEGNPESVGRSLQALRAHTHLPVAAGFGVRTPEQARALSRESDFVVVGTELVRTIHEGAAETAAQRCRETIAGFKAAMRSSRTPFARVLQYLS
jgi:tryptophan synthase alpha chain